MKGFVLVGFMGTGKTVVGRELASRLQWDRLDTDKLIIIRAGKSISGIFSEDGEPAFRAMETGVLEALMTGHAAPRVISTGGGIVLAENNWPLLRGLGRVICLWADPEVIRQRVGTAADRPLLAGTPEEVRGRIDKLLRERQAAYSQADWSCNTNQCTPAEIADQILARFNMGDSINV